MTVTVHTEKINDNERIRVVYDQHYQTRGSYGYDTEEETKAAEDYEIERLNSGQWVALGAIRETRCAACGSWEVADSLWGIVVENTDAGFAEAADMVRS